VVGADIHVFANGLPLYLFMNWQPVPASDRGWLRELPSRMLNAHRAVVPFTGRDGDLAQLRSWRDDGSRLAVRWLYGPGGQGKTRLAAQLAADSAAAGWKVVVAVHGQDADRPPPGSHDMRLDGATGLLVIADYADRWLPTNLTWLLRNALLHRPGVATRVLMVARTVDAWPAVNAILETYQARTSSHRLPALPRDSGERVSMFIAARDSFAAIYGLPDADGIEQPGPLDDAEFGLTLTVHMAALAAVDSLATGARPPSGVAGLTIYLLDREQLHWGRLYADGAAAEAAEGTAYRTPPAVMNQAVFIAALAGPLRVDDAVVVLERLGLPDPGQVLADQAVCYPAADRRHGAVLEPLYPDRLAEDFLALTMTGHTADYPAQPWAGPTVTTLLERRGDQGDPAAWTPRAVTFLASAGQRWPHLGTGYLYPLLLGDPQLAIDAGNLALTAIADLPAPPTALLEAIEARFPENRHVDLDTGIAALATRLADQILSTSLDAEERARVKHDLAIRLSRAGHRHQAVTAAQEAVAATRGLAGDDRGTYDANLAGSLNTLSACLSDLNRWEEAAAAIQEAITIQRRLAEDDPFYEIFLATALSGLGVDLLRLGQQQKALAAAQEAVSILRRPPRTDPVDHKEALATSLLHLATILADAAMPQQALAAAREAVRILRRLAKANPAAYEPTLAAALSNLGAGLSGVSRPSKALAASREAVALWRQLAKANPTAHDPGLAAALANLSADQWHLGLREQSVSANHEAISIYRRLARADPVAHQATLAASLFDLSLRLLALWRPDQALPPAREAVEIGRHLANSDPAQEADFASSLDNLSNVLSRLRRTDEAAATDAEAVTVYRHLAETDPATNEPELAASLTNLGARMSDLGRWDDALAAAEDAAGLYRRLAEADGGYEPALARALFNLARIYSGLDRPTEAVPVAHEAVTAYRRLVRVDPAANESGLAASLSNLSADLNRLGRPEEALTGMREVLGIRRRQAKAAPAAREAELGRSENNLAAILSELGQHEEALAVTSEAVALWRRLAKTGTAVSEPDLARSLWIYAQVRAAAQCELSRAFSSVKEACALYRGWNQPLPTEYSSDPEGALRCAVWILTSLGYTAESANLSRFIEANELTKATDLVNGIGLSAKQDPSCA
jgi:hypothetical protein